MRLFFFIWLFIFISCHYKEIKKTDISAKTKKDTLTTAYYFPDTVLQNRITDTLFKLDFVKRSHKYIDSFTHHKHGIAFMLDTLKRNDSEIFVIAGYNGNLRFETYYQFYINPRSLSIKVYDPVTDQKLSVKEFIKLQK